MGDGEGQRTTGQAPFRPGGSNSRAGDETKQTLQSCGVSRVSRGLEQGLDVADAPQTFVEEEKEGGMAGPLGSTAAEGIVQPKVCVGVSSLLLETSSERDF